MTSAPVRHRAWLTSDDCDLAEFRTIVAVETDPADVAELAAQTERRRSSLAG